MGREVKVGVNDIRTCRPDIAECMDRRNLLDPLENPKDNIPDFISVSGTSQVYCMCSKGHSFNRKANKMSQLQRNENGYIICPICSGKEIVKGINSLGDLRKDLLEEWDWKKNISIDPYTISPRSNKKVYWICNKNHTWKTSPNSRINQKEGKIYGCRFCAKQEMWPGETDALTVLKKLHREDVIKEFELGENNLELSKLFFHGTKKYNFKCPVCGTRRKKTFIEAVNHKCSGCTNQTVTKFNNLKVRYPFIAEKYDKSNVNKIPSDKIIMGGNKKYGFYCEVCNAIYYDTLAHQVSGRGCTVCANAHRTSWSEQMLYFGLKVSAENLNIMNRYTIDNCIFDIFIEDLGLIIEYDGEYWHSLERTIEREKVYNKIANENNFTLLRLKEKSTENLGNKNYYTLYKEEDVYIIYIPISRNTDDSIKVVGKVCCDFIFKIYSLQIDFRYDLIPLEEVTKNTLYDRGKKSLINQDIKFVQKYWDYKQNELLNITPNLVTPTSHIKVYLKINGVSELKRLDTFYLRRN